MSSILGELAHLVKQIHPFVKRLKIYGVSVIKSAFSTTFQMFNVLTTLFMEIQTSW